MKKLKQIPNFNNEDEEREFWAKSDSSEYFDWSKSEEIIFPNLKPSTESISLRLPSIYWLVLKRLQTKRYSLSIFNENLSKRENESRIKDVIGSNDVYSSKPMSYS